MARAKLLIAIDGPAGAGKSTAARRVADRVGYVLVDTGALYRCVALAAARAGLLQSGTAPERIGELATKLADERGIRLDEGGKVFLQGEDVSTQIRSPEMSLGASFVSAIPEVRLALLAMQRQAGEAGGAVLEGRDIGTVVFPDADLKFFLTASAAERASRRHAELSEKGAASTLAETLADVERRDKADSERAVAPLKKADDAILLDSSTMSIDEVVDFMVARIVSREAAP